MKKIYLVFSLLLMVLGINTAYAGVTLGSQVTNPSTLTAGNKIIIRANGAANAEAGTYKFMASLVDSLVYAISDPAMIDPYVAFELEAAEGKTVDGQAAFYLKNNYNGKYLTYIFEEGEDGSISDDGSGKVIAEMRQAFTDDKTKATPVIIVTQAVGAEMMNYTGNAPTEADCMMIIAEFPENENSLIAFNYVENYPVVATYNDWATWHQIFMADINEDDYYTDLANLYVKVQEINFIAGEDPGCYDATLVEAFNNAKAEADKALNGGEELTNEEYKAAYKTLETAYLALVIAQPVAVSEGYYRIISAYPGYQTTQGDDALMTIWASNSDSHMNWKKLDSNDATMVWQFIDRKDGTWLLYNVGTGQYINGTNGNAFQSPWYSLSNDSTDNAITFTNLGQSQFNIARKGVNSFHTGGHNNGSGTSGNVVAYNGGLNTASAWYIRSVEEEKIPEFEAIGKQNMLNRTLSALYDQAKAKYEIGSTFNIDTVKAHWLVTSADYEKDSKVVMSNADHNEWHPSAHDGAGIPGLIDDDVNTFWGSCWSDPQPDTTQYLQFKLNKSVDCFAVYLTRRTNQGNQATSLTFYASNDTANADNWVKVGSISGLPGSIPASGVDPAYQSTGIEMGAKYQYIRMYWTSGNGFTHFTGFHFQEASLNPKCQNAQMGATADNLKKELENAATLINEGTATQEAINSLQAAYEAYIEALADPTILKAKLDSITTVANNAATPSMLHNDGSTVVFKAGQPGVYTDEAKNALKAVVAEVQEYVNKNDADGTYTKAEISTNIEKLTTALATFKATAPQFNVADANGEGIWYYLSASKHYYDVTGNSQNTSGEGDNLQVRNGRVFVDVANINVDILNNARLAVTGTTEEDDDNYSDDNAKWRFVNMGDTAYAIQNKATGLYIGEKTGGNAGLSMTPTAFKLSDIGYATFILDGYRYTGERTAPLHVQTNGQVVVFWDNYDLGNGSCFDIEATTEAVMMSKPTINFETIVKGKLYTKCYPISIDYLADASNTGAWPYQIATIDVEKKEMTLSEYGDVITAGTPFFYIGGGSELGVTPEPTAEDTTSLMGTLQHDKIIAQTPGSYNGLIGTFYNNVQVAKGFGVVRDVDGVQSIGATTEGQTIGWNNGYIDVAQIENADERGEIVVPLTGNLETAIKDAIIDAQTGNVNVYSIDGILIKKNVKASEATKGLAKGIYIVGNKKIAVQ